MKPETKQRTPINFFKMALQVGDKAPDFTVNDQDGNPVKLSDLKGKKVVLYFYPKDMTPGCTTEACNLRDNYKLMQKQGFEVLGVSTDSEKLHKKFIEKEKLPFRLLADTNKTLHEAYGTWVEKSMYGRNYMGTARITYVIDEAGKIAEIIGKVDTKNHAAQILKDGASSKVKVVAKKVSVAKKAPAKKVKKAAKKAAPKKSSKK
jgi:thioredoxin-dependent peroxiredoxin